MLKTVSSITNAIGALNYKGTWNASTNTPTITSSVGVKGDYYQVSVAGSTAINGISNWGVGDVIAFNGSTWQRIEGGADLNGVNLSVSGTTTLSGLTASTALALNAGKDVVSVTNTGTGNNVLADGPTLTTPALGAATATSVNKVAITAPANGSTLTIADGKTLTANNSLTLAGTDATTMTFPSTNATIARTDAAQTFTGNQTIAGDVIVGTQTNKATVTYATNTARTLTVPNVGGNRTFAFINENQTFTGTQTFSTIKPANLVGNPTGTVAADGNWHTILTDSSWTLRQIIANVHASGRHSDAVFLAAAAFQLTNQTAVLIRTNYNSAGQVEIQWSGDNLQLRTSVNFGAGANIEYSYFVLSGS